MIDEIIISSIARACLAADASYIADAGVESDSFLSSQSAKAFVRSIIDRDEFRPFKVLDVDPREHQASIMARNRLWRAIVVALRPSAEDQ